MRNKILAELVKKFPGLSKQFLGLLADKLAKKVTEESGIEQAITDYDNAVSITDLATDFQKEGDRRVTDAKKEWDKKSGKTDDDDPADDDDEPAADPKAKGKSKKKDPDEPPGWAKKLMQDLDSLKADKTKTSIQSKLAEKLKGKVPEKFYSKRSLPEKEEDLDAFVEEVETDYTEFKQTLVNEGLALNGGPVGGNGGSGGDANSKTIQADIDKYVAKKSPAKATT